jgi:transposase
MLMNRAYEGDETCGLARSKGHEPIAPPKKKRGDPGESDREKYKRRNVVEWRFRRLKEFRKVRARYDKLDFMFLAFTQFAFVMIWLN